jgi:hypothetical protein
MVVDVESRRLRSRYFFILFYKSKTLGVQPMYQAVALGMVEISREGNHCAESLPDPNLTGFSNCAKLYDQWRNDYEE